MSEGGSIMPDKADPSIMHFVMRESPSMQNTDTPFQEPSGKLYFKSMQNIDYIP